MNYIKFSSTEHRVVAVGVALLVAYFLIMDSELYRCVQSLVLRPGTGKFPTGKEPEVELQVNSPFYGLTIKTMMLNHVNHYIIEPLAATFNQVTHFSEVFYFITPNMVSGCGIIFAGIAGYMVSSDYLVTRQLAVLVYQLRSFMDALDGVLFRARIKMRTNISAYGSLGYYVDGFCDTIGTIAFMTGILCHLMKRKSNAKLGYVGLSIWSREKSDVLLAPGGVTSSYGCSRGFISSISSSSKSVGAVLACFGFILAASSYFWDQNISRYYTLLQEAPPTNSRQAEMQEKLFKSSSMFFIAWLWRMCNSFFFMNMLNVSVVVDKVWDFLTRIQFTGIFMLAGLMFITEIHFQILKSNLDEVGPMSLTRNVTGVS